MFTWSKLHTYSARKELLPHGMGGGGLETQKKYVFPPWSFLSINQNSKLLFLRPLLWEHWFLVFIFFGNLCFLWDRPHTQNGHVITACLQVVVALPATIQWSTQFTTDVQIERLGAEKQNWKVQREPISAEGAQCRSTWLLLMALLLIDISPFVFY